MSHLDNNDNVTQSTLFSDPNQNYQKEKKPKRKNLLATSLIALAVVVSIVAASVAIKAFVPDNDTDNSSSTNTMSVAVTEYSGDDVAKLTVTTKDYKTVLYSKMEETASDSTTVSWYVDGVDASLTSSYNIGTAVEAAVNLAALRKMESANADYGFDNAQTTVQVESRNKAFENYTLTVGNMSPDKSGHYVKTNLSDSVYLVSAETVGAFCKDIYAFANTTVISALTDGDAPEEYFNDGTLIKVDSISLSGTDYGMKEITFSTNKDEDTAPFMTYVMNKPYNRYADNEKVKALISPLANGVYAETCYSYNATAKELKKYKLNNPEIIITLKADKHQHTVKASVSEDGYYAVMLDDKKAIYKVESSYLALGDKKAESFISTVVFSEMLNHFTKIDVTVDGKTYDFGIEFDEENEEGVCSVTAGNTPIKAENFQNYYAQLLGMTLTEISTKTPDADIAMSVILTRTDGTKAILEFAKTAERRYHVSVDGNPGGYISSTTYDNLQSFVKLAYSGDEVPSITQK